MAIYNIDLKKYLTLKAIARLIERRKKYQSYIRKTVFTRSQQHPLPVIGLDEITRVIQNVAVVRRGTAAVPMKHGSRKIEYIEPQGVDVSDFITAKDINDMKLMSTQNIQALVNGRLDYMLETVQRTTGALCAQAIAGKISYPMVADGANETYDVDFGDTVKLAAADITLLTSSSTIKDVYLLLDAMHSKLEDSNWGSDDVVVMAGKDAYAMILGIAETKSSKQNVINVKVTKGSIEIGGYTIIRNKKTYMDRTGLKKEVADNVLCMIDLEAPHTLFYCAIDDIDANMVAAPFWSSPGETRRNPSGIEMLGKSKPLPAPVVKAICWTDPVVSVV